MLLSSIRSAQIQSPNRQRGFTLIEIMVTVIILAILAAIVIPRILERPAQARIAKAKQDILAIENAAELYKLDNGDYPSRLEDLVKRPNNAKNWPTGGYLKNIPKDPWQREYYYDKPGRHKGVDIYTKGAEGTGRGSGENAQIGNWNAGESSPVSN